MDMHRLEVFCKVIECKSFTKAAEAVFLSQPTVSEHIRSLEESLNVRLIDRLGREAQPTQAGKILYRHAKKILRMRQEAVAAIESFTGTPSGHLWVGASTIPGTYLLPELVGAFKERHPTVQITLSIANSRRVAEQVLAGDSDFGIVGAQWTEPGLSWEKIFADELVLVVHRDHPWAGRREAALPELAGESFITRERESGTQKVANDILAAHGFDLSSLNIIAEMGSTEAVRQSVKAKIGMAIISRQAVAEDLDGGSLKEIAISGVSFHRPFYLVSRRQRHLSPICALFLDFLRQGASHGGRS